MERAKIKEKLRKQIISPELNELDDYYHNRCGNRIAKILGFKFDPFSLKPEVCIKEQLGKTRAEDLLEILLELKTIRKFMAKVWYEIPSKYEDRLKNLEKSIGYYEIFLLKTIKGLDIEEPGFAEIFLEDKDYRGFLKTSDREYWRYTGKYYDTKFDDIDRFRKKIYETEYFEKVESIAKELGISWSSWRITGEDNNILGEYLKKDDFIAGWALDILDLPKGIGEDFKKDIKTYYINPLKEGKVVKNYLDVLLEIERTYHEINYREKIEVPWKKELEKNPDTVLDIYFKYLDWIKSNTLHGNTKYYSPGVIKFVLTTIISG